MLETLKHTPRTSAQTLNKIQHNLTLADWMQVYSFIDAHPDVAQAQIVQHFSSLKTNALLFNQSTLLHKLWERPKMEAYRPHIVTSLAVECALIYWIQHMEAKGDTMTEKVKLMGDGWVQSFCKTYKICKHWQHGEAGSVDMDAVQVEQECCQKILTQYTPRDQWNFDETALFPQ
ncbi:hypothetical protein BS17DRAFT_798588 [Gyrodon lividus]|nr:hypothetical protein BS17DRAFT_798588 [Gyrodon lividus]